MSPVQMLSEGSRHVDNDPSAPAGVWPRSVSAASEAIGVSNLDGEVADASETAYGEEAFHYFLEVELRRAEVSNRPFLLMLVDSRYRQDGDVRIDQLTAGRVFGLLSRCVRDTDFLGWYREGRVAGAVLTQDGDPERDDLSEPIRLRVSAEFERHFGSGFQVRVFQVSPTLNVRSES
jgi:hypothetical protein